MTFATETTGARAWRVAFFVEIAGIPKWLTDRTIKATASITIPQIPCIVPGGLSFGETRLELAQYRQVGSTFSVDLADVAGELSALFASRSRAVAWVTDSTVSTTASTINVNTTSGLPASGTVYINGETITYTGTTATSLTGCTRGAHGSKAQKHYGAAFGGPGVFDTPTVWRGRRAKIKATYIDAEGIYGNDVDNVQTLMTVRMTQPPQYKGEGRWQLDFEELSASFAGQLCYVGQRIAELPPGGVTVKTATYTPSAETFTGYDITWTNAETEVDLFDYGGGTFGYSRILAQTEDGVELYPYYSRNASTLFILANTVRPITAANSGNKKLDAQLDVINAKLAAYEEEQRLESWFRSFQHVVWLNGSPYSVLRTLLESKTSGMVNSPFDVLPGKERTAYGKPSWRMGAGIDVADIDTDSFAEAANFAARWSFLLKEEISVADILEEFCKVSGAFWYVTREGKLAARRLIEANDLAPTVTQTAITDSQIVAATAETMDVDQQRVVNGLLFRSNYNFATDEYDLRNLIVDWAYIDQFPDATEVREWSSKFIKLDTTSAAMPADSATMNIEQMTGIIRQMQASSARPRAYINLECAWSLALVDVGSIVRLTTTKVPNLVAVAGVSGTVSQSCLVVGKEFNATNATVKFRLMLLDAAYRFAPFGLVSSYNTTTKTATLSTSHNALGTLTPGKHFSVGWDCWFVDTTGATPNVWNTVTITGKTDTTITFSANPSFTPTAGDLILPKDAASTNATTNDSSLKAEDYTWQVPLTLAGRVSRWV